MELPSPTKKEERRMGKRKKTSSNHMNSTVAALDLSEKEGGTTILSISLRRCD
ncbi:MAG TPA: hypothetical protein VNI77_00710 [Nitrososphaera sp.]|nr:hypothetical protein [Nitrososphaera sp.]